jgi:acyl-CoA thioester hydrolase
VVYVRHVEDVARAHAESVGITFEAVTRLGAVPVVRRHDIAYHRAETVGDRLEVSTVIEQGKGVRWLKRTDLRRESELLAHAVTEWVWVDPETRRPKRLPSASENALGFGEGE